MPVIRPATLADEEAVLRLYEELFAPPARRPPDFTRERAAAGFRHAVMSPDADLLVALDGETLAGLASVYREFPSVRFGWRCWVEDLVVVRERRSGGIGRALLDAAIEWARARGCTHLELSSAPARRNAHRFYLTNGMEQSSHLFTADRLNPERLRAGDRPGRPARRTL